MSDFKLCKKAGLTFMRSHWAGHAEGDGFQYVVSASDVEKLLRDAPVVASNYGQHTWVREDKDDPEEFNNIIEQGYETSVTARLLMIEPIVKDTAESLLREMLEGYDKNETPCSVYERARKLLRE